MSRIKLVLKSIVALAASVAITFILSYGTDAILIAVNAMPKNALPESALLVAFIVAYRTIYNATGAYVLAKLAPVRPLLHVLGLAAFGVVGSLAAMASIDTPIHAWYGWVLTALILPSAWVGAKLALQKS